jgi:hypothetical protein
MILPIISTSLVKNPSSEQAPGYCACSSDWPHRRFTPPAARAKLTEAEEKRMADTRNGGGKATGSARKGKGSSRTKKVMAAATAGAAIGIGSAALVAALLYANRPKEEKGEEPTTDPRFEPGEA